MIQPTARIRRFRLALLVVVLLPIGAAWAQGPWTPGPWTDPADGARLPAITTPIDFGPTGIGAFVCTSEGAGGLSFVIATGDIADAPDEPITMSYNAGGTGDDVVDFASWTREPGGIVVRFAGSDEELAALIDAMNDSVSTAFFWSFGPLPTTEEEMAAMQEAGRVVVAVFDSQRDELAPVLASLPCSAR